MDRQELYNCGNVPMKQTLLLFLFTISFFFMNESTQHVALKLLASNSVYWCHKYRFTYWGNNVEVDDCYFNVFNEPGLYSAAWSKYLPKAFYRRNHRFRDTSVCCEHWNSLIFLWVSLMFKKKHIDFLFILFFLLAFSCRVKPQLADCTVIDLTVLPRHQKANSIGISYLIYRLCSLF